MVKLGSGEFVSIPASYKYTKADSDLFSLYDDFLDTYTYYDFNRNTLLAAYSTFDSMDENFGEITFNFRYLCIGSIKFRFYRKSIENNYF